MWLQYLAASVLACDPDIHLFNIFESPKLVFSTESDLPFRSIHGMSADILFYLAVIHVGAYDTTYPKTIRQAARHQYNFDKS